MAAGDPAREAFAPRSSEPIAWHARRRLVPSGCGRAGALPVGTDRWGDFRAARLKRTCSGPYGEAHAPDPSTCAGDSRRLSGVVSRLRAYQEVEVALANRSRQRPHNTGRVI